MELNIEPNAGIVVTDPDQPHQSYIHIDGIIFACSVTGGPIPWSAIPQSARDATSDAQLAELGITRDGDVIG